MTVGAEGSCIRHPWFLDNLKLAPRTKHNNAADGSFCCNVGVFRVVTWDT